MPITWKNVEGRGASDAALLMAGAAKSVQAAGENFTSALDANKSRVEAISATEREANTDRFKDALAASTTVGQLESNEANINALRQQFDGGNIDQDLLREGYNDRLKELRTEETAANDYQMGVDKKAANPLAQQFKALVLADKDEQANQMLTDNADLFDRVGMTADLNTFLDNRNQTEITRKDKEKDRLLTETTRISNEGFDEMLTNMEQFNSEYDAIAWFNANQEKYNVSPTVFNSRLGEVRENFRANNELSARDTQLVEDYSALADATATQIEDNATANKARIYAANPTDNNQSWSESVNSTNAANLALEKGYDKNANPQGVIDKALTSWFDNMEGKLPEGFEAMRGNLAVRAIEMLDTGEGLGFLDPFDWGDKDLDQETMEAALEQAYQEYTTFTFMEANRLEADTVYESEIARALQERNSVGEYRTSLLNTAKLKLKGQQVPAKEE